MIVSSVLITAHVFFVAPCESKWISAVSVRIRSRCGRLFHRSLGMFLEFGVAVSGLCLFRVLSRSLATENSVDIEPFTYCFVT